MRSRSARLGRPWHTADGLFATVGRGTSLISQRTILSTSTAKSADRIGCADRAIDQGGEAADRRDPDQGAAEGANAGTQQLRLAAEALQPAGGAIARALDALQALLAALADRDQLGLDLPAAFDCEVIPGMPMPGSLVRQALLALAAPQSGPWP